MKNKFTLLVILLILTNLRNIYSFDSTFTEAKKYILEHNGTLKASEQEIKAAQATISHVKKYENPEISLQLDNFGRNEIEATVAQKFELGKRRDLRIRNAQNDLNNANNHLKIAEHDLELKIYETFLPIISIQKRIALLDSSIMLMNDLYEQMKRKSVAGAVRKSDLLRIEIDMENLKLQKGDFELQLKDARHRFASLGGNNNDSHLLQINGTLVHEFKIPSIDTLLKTIQSNVNIAQLNLIKEGKLIEQKIAKANIFPTVNVSVGYIQDNIENRKSPLIGISSTLPIVNRNQHLQKQIGYELDALNHQQEIETESLKTEIVSLHSKIIGMISKIETLKSNIIPRANEIFNLSKEYYNSGNANYADLTKAQSELLTIQKEIIDLVEDCAINIIELRRVTFFHIPIVNEED